MFQLQEHFDSMYFAGVRIETKTPVELRLRGRTTSRVAAWVVEVGALKVKQIRTLQDNGFLKLFMM